MSSMLTFFFILLSIQNKVTSFPIYRDVIDKIPGNCSAIRPKISRLNLKTCSCNEKQKTITSNDYGNLICQDQSDAGYCDIYQPGGKSTDTILITPNSPPNIALMNCVLPGCNSVYEVKLWNIDQNGKGKWFNIDSLGKKYLKIISGNVLSVPNFVTRSWAGHAMRVKYGGNMKCSIIKFKGNNTYPFSLDEFKKKHPTTTSKPTVATTLSSTTSTLMPATVSSSSKGTLITTRGTKSTKSFRTENPTTKLEITTKVAKTTPQVKMTTTQKISPSTKAKIATTETKMTPTQKTDTTTKGKVATTAEIKTTTQTKMTPKTEAKIATTEEIKSTSLSTKTKVKSNSSISPVTSPISKTTTLEFHSSTKTKIKSTTFENITEASKTTPSVQTVTTRRSTSFNPSTDKLVATHSRNSTIFYVAFVLLVIVAIACVSVFLARRRVNSKRNLNEIRVKIVDVENEPALEYSNPGYRKINVNNEYDGASIESKEDLKEKEYKIDEFSAINDNHYATPRPSTDKHDSQENLYSEIPGLSKDRDESNGLYNNLGESEEKEKESEYYANMKV